MHIRIRIVRLHAADLGWCFLRLVLDSMTSCQSTMYIIFSKSQAPVRPRFIHWYFIFFMSTWIREQYFHNIDTSLFRQLASDNCWSVVKKVVSKRLPSSKVKALPLPTNSVQSPRCMYYLAGGTPLLSTGKVKERIEPQWDYFLL